jgi:septal ring factor EnvC (AmiA/AmiB activator)
MQQPPDVPPPTRDPDDEPARQGDLRTLRRWLIVAGVWAVAASAIGLIALLSQDDSSDEESRQAVSKQLSNIRKDLGEINDRIDSVEDEVSQAASAEDISKLENRLGRVEDDVAKAGDDAKSASDSIGDLEGRIEDLETEVGAGGGAQDEQTP